MYHLLGFSNHILLICNITRSNVPQREDLCDSCNRKATMYKTELNKNQNFSVLLKTRLQLKNIITNKQSVADYNDPMQCSGAVEGQLRICQIFR